MMPYYELALGVLVGLPIGAVLYILGRVWRDRRGRRRRDRELAVLFQRRLSAEPPRADTHTRR